MYDHITFLTPTKILKVSVVLKHRVSQNDFNALLIFGSLLVILAYYGSLWVILVHFGSLSVILAYSVF